MMVHKEEQRERGRGRGGGNHRPWPKRSAWTSTSTVAGLVFRYTSPGGDGLFADNRFQSWSSF